MPATPSTATCAPSGMRRVASATPSTIGTPRSRASDAKWEVLPPRSVTTPATRGRTWPRAGPATRVTRRNAPDLAFAIDHNRAPGCPADARRMPVETRVLQPDLVGHVRRLHVERARLQQLESVLIQRPFDLHGHT